MYSCDVSPRAARRPWPEGSDHGQAAVLELRCPGPGRLRRHRPQESHRRRPARPDRRPCDDARPCYPPGRLAAGTGLETGVVLVTLVRRTIGQRRAGRHPLPLVAATGPLPATGVHRSPAPRRSRAAGRMSSGRRGTSTELVEDSVFGRWCFARVVTTSSPMRGGPQRCSEVIPRAPEPAGSCAGVIVTVQVTDDDSNLAQPCAVSRVASVASVRREASTNDPRSGEVFDGVSGQDHLRERDDMRPTVRSVCGEPQHQVGVGLQRPDGRIDLSEGETDLVGRPRAYGSHDVRQAVDEAFDRRDRR